MRMIVAAALAASFCGAAWAAEPAKAVTAVEKTSAVTQQVDQKEWAQAQCWICLPWHSDKN
jgi:hypothetical protein